MSKEKTKLAIVSKVLALEDEVVLANMHAFLVAEPTMRWPEKGPQVTGMIDRSLKELDGDEGRSHQEVMKPYATWLERSAGRQRQKRASGK